MRGGLIRGGDLPAPCLVSGLHLCLQHALGRRRQLLHARTRVSARALLGHDGFPLDEALVCRVECCTRCLAQGVNAAHIIDGRQQHSLLMEMLTDEGVGTMITG